MESHLDNRNRLLLTIVREGTGRWDARTIDVLLSSRHGPSVETVREDLLRLCEQGLVVVDESKGVGGLWSITEKGEQALAEGTQLGP